MAEVVISKLPVENGVKRLKVEKAPARPERRGNNQLELGEPVLGETEMPIGIVHVK